MNLETLFVILAIIEVITLICFFVLCINVSVIKKTVSVPEPWQGSFNLYYSTGQIEEAKDILMKAIRNDSKFISAFFSNLITKENDQKYISEKYGYFLHLVGLDIDFNKMNDFIAKV